MINLLLLNVVILAAYAQGRPPPLAAARAATVSRDLVKFSMETILDATLPVVHPLVAAGSSKCEFIKSFFGITYDQMPEKKVLSVQEGLTIDLITSNGSVKYNMSQRVGKIMSDMKMVAILIHGFMESSDGVMVQNVAPHFLKRGDYVFALDGRNIITFEYLRSSTYVRLLGEKLGQILADAVEEGQDANTIMLVGHSLGAHIAGIAGKELQRLTGQRVGRITALDPAGPCFTTADPATKLHRNDAVYVDVIHTNAGILGIKETVGHKDFYPNGGMSQPGCILATCDHSRAWELFAESISFPDRFPARKCENWTLNKDGRCLKNEVAFLGLDSGQGSPGSYFLTTRSSPPYGLGTIDLYDS